MIVGPGALWRNGSAPQGPVRYEQLTHFADSVTSPALSPDGRMLTFIRGEGTFTGRGEIYVQTLPDGDPVQLTRDGFTKMGPVFLPDGARIAYTVTEGGHHYWDTWVVPVLGGAQPSRMQYIGRLQIPMDDAGLVRRGEPRGDLSCDGRGPT